MSSASHQAPRTTLIYALVAIAGLILLLVWMEGGFTRKTPPGAVAEAKAGPVAGSTARVLLEEIDEIMAWPGTVTARTVADLAPKVAARVLEVKVRAGDAVQAGQVLVRLDEREFQARLNQARSALAAAQAQAGRIQADARRTENLFAQEAATAQALDAARAAARAASAQVEEARAAVAEAESAFAETALKAPFDGAVVRRHMDPGDMALPGSAVLTLQSGQRLRVETSIPETCARTIRQGETLKVRIGEQAVDARVEEVAPAADPATHTVLVKAGLAADAGVQPGRFAWIEQACGRRRALLLPAESVSRVGQLESVRLVEDGRVKLRHVRTGKVYDGRVEVLSGLKEGDLVQLGGER